MPDTPENSENKNSQEPEAEKPEYRQISDEELKEILAAHKKWLETNFNEGARADLSNVDLSEKCLKNIDLYLANLQGVDLFGANLQDADLSDANLHKAYLANANLQRVKLTSANLQEAFLLDTKLQDAKILGANLEEANLSFANLQDAKLTQAKFQNANLSFANLQDATMEGANFQDTNLLRANLKYADLGGASLINANIDIADLYRADFGFATMICCSLRGCNLKDVKGFDSPKLAQADITNAKLDEKVSEFKALGTAEEASRNAKKIFFSMLLACVYSWLTIGSTNDVALLTNSSSSNLPIIQTAIPIAWFYLVAPVLLTSFYIYLHLYLRRLWQALAGLPAIFEDGKPLDERAYPWMLNGLVRRHFIRLKGEYEEIEKGEKESAVKWYIRKTFFLWLWYRIKGSRPFTARLEEWVSIFLAWWIVPLTLGWFWLRYLTRHDWSGTIWQVVLIIVTVLAGIIFYRVHAQTLAGVMFKRIKTLEYIRWISLAMLIFMLILVSDGGINGQRKILWGGHDFTRHNLTSGSTLIPRTFIWSIFDNCGYNIFADFREEYISNIPDNYWLMDTTFRDNAVIGARLAGADLRFAEGERAFLVNADMRGANMEGIFLIEANLKGANLSPLIKGGFSKSSNLSYSHLSGVNFTGAQLNEVDFTGAAINQAYFDGAKLYKANFSNSYLYAASFGDAELVETDFSGANLSAVMGLTQDQLDSAFGDSATILPPGLTIPIK